jgi:hypothetical protein
MSIALTGGTENHAAATTNARQIKIDSLLA